MEKGLELNFNGERFSANPENTTLYTFVGKLAMYNHIFFQTGESSGTYLFASLNPVYEDIEDHLMTNDYPAVLNQLRVADCDLSAFDRNVEAMVPDDTEGL